MPISTVPYKRSYAHTKSRGKEGKVRCGFCGKRVPRWKSFVKYRGLRIRDPVVLKQVGRYRIHLPNQKMYVCLSCARFRKIVKPGKSVRKKHLKRYKPGIPRKRIKI
jgi:small subunit ribosomal protein S26e